MADAARIIVVATAGINKVLRLHRCRRLICSSGWVRLSRLWAGACCGRLRGESILVGLSGHRAAVAAPGRHARYFPSRFSDQCVNPRRVVLSGLLPQFIAPDTPAAQTAFKFLALGLLLRSTAFGLVLAGRWRSPGGASVHYCCSGLAGLAFRTWCGWRFVRCLRGQAGVERYPARTLKTGDQHLQESTVMTISPQQFSPATHHRAPRNFSMMKCCTHAA